MPAKTVDAERVLPFTGHRILGITVRLQDTTCRLLTLDDVKLPGLFGGGSMQDGDFSQESTCHHPSLYLDLLSRKPGRK